MVQIKRAGVKRKQLQALIRPRNGSGGRTTSSHATVNDTSGAETLHSRHHCGIDQDALAVLHRSGRQALNSRLSSQRLTARQRQSIRRTHNGGHATPPLSSPTMMRQKPATSMQKTYDDCYLICSTAVYFESQVRTIDALDVSMFGLCLLAYP